MKFAHAAIKLKFIGNRSWRRGALRELILTLAVQGKLVPQDPKDEPASALLKKIRAEKDRLIADKKIRRSKPLDTINESACGFVSPTNWAWKRLENLGDGGLVPRPLGQIAIITAAQFHDSSPVG